MDAPDWLTVDYFTRVPEHQRTYSYNGKVITYEQFKAYMKAALNPEPPKDKA